MVYSIDTPRNKCRLFNKKTTVNRVYHYDKEQAINVRAITLKPGSIKNDISYTGTFEPNKETKISADVQGKINSVLVNEGSSVRKSTRNTKIKGLRMK